MRRRLVALGVAAAATVAAAFGLPLLRFVGEVAHERAIAAAERDAATVTGALRATTVPAGLEAVLGATEAGAEGRLTVFLPGGAVVGATAPGPVEEAGDEVELARRSDAPFEVDTDGGALWLVPVPGEDGIAVVRVAIPAAELDRGVGRARLAIGLLAAAVVAAGAVIADRLARSVTGPAGALSAAAERVAAGDLDARVDPTGPPELASVATAFNHLASRVSGMVAEAREGVADLSHRLRTPLTAMRLDAESVADPDERDRLLGDVGELERVVDTVIADARRPERRTLTPVADLGDVTRDRTAFWAALAEDQHRPWHVDVVPDRCPVAAPPDDLADALDALLDNVFTHTPPGTACSVTTTVDGSSARLVVADEGPGFPAAAGSPGTGGDGRSGLGLDIARRVARSAGGSLQVETDGGAVVTIELPLVGH